MAKKLSKSDLPAQENEEFWAWHDNTPQSQHFAPGTFALTGGVRGEILDRLDNILTVRWEDGSVGHIKPIALNRS